MFSKDGYLALDQASSDAEQARLENINAMLKQGNIEGAMEAYSDARQEKFWYGGILQSIGRDAIKFKSYQEAFWSNVPNRIVLAALEQGKMNQLQFSDKVRLLNMTASLDAEIGKRVLAEFGELKKIPVELHPSILDLANSLFLNGEIEKPSEILAEVAELDFFLWESNRRFRVLSLAKALASEGETESAIKLLLKIESLPPATLDQLDSGFFYNATRLAEEVRAKNTSDPTFNEMLNEIIVEFKERKTKNSGVTPR